MKLSTAKDFQVEYKYRFTHTVEKKKGVEIILRNLEENQMVIWGDGETFHYLLTQKPSYRIGIIGK